MQNKNEGGSDGQIRSAFTDQQIMTDMHIMQ